MKNTNSKRLIIVISLFTLCSCVKVETEFTNVSEGSITKIRIKKDDGKNLKMKYVITDVQNKNSAMAIFESQNCNYFDESNWSCDDTDIIEMKDGNLTIYSNGKAQVFKDEKKLIFK